MDHWWSEDHSLRKTVLDSLNCISIDGRCKLKTELKSKYIFTGLSQLRKKVQFCNLNDKKHVVDSESYCLHFTDLSETEKSHLLCSNVAQNTRFTFCKDYGFW